MDDFWKLFVFRLNNKSYYLVPVYYCPLHSTYEEQAWILLAQRLSRSVERTKQECKLLHEIYNGGEIIKL